MELQISLAAEVISTEEMATEENELVDLQNSPAADVISLEENELAELQISTAAEVISPVV